MAPGLPELGLQGTGFITHPLSPNSFGLAGGDHPRPGRPRSGTWGGGSGGGETGCRQRDGGCAASSREALPPRQASAPHPGPTHQPPVPCGAVAPARAPRAPGPTPPTQPPGASARSTDRLAAQGLGWGRRDAGGRSQEGAWRARAEWVVLRPAPRTELCGRLPRRCGHCSERLRDSAAGDRVSGELPHPRRPGLASSAPRAPMTRHAPRAHWPAPGPARPARSLARPRPCHTPGPSWPGERAGCTEAGGRAALPYKAGAAQGRGNPAKEASPGRWARGGRTWPSGTSGGSPASPRQTARERTGLREGRGDGGALASPRRLGPTRRPNV